MVTAEEFPLFPRLPPELRHQIWRTALTQPWSVTSFKRVGRSVRCVGQVHLAVGQSCREAREVMKLTHTKVEARWSTRWREGQMFLGWICFDRHLFIVRDIEHDLGLLKDVLSHGLLAHARHLVVNAGDYWLQYETARLLKQHCPALRSVVVVAPWRDRTLPVNSNIPPNLRPYEDWGPLFRRSPSEIDWSPLTRAVEAREPKNIYRQAWDQHKIEKLLSESPDDTDKPPPLFYMRTREDIHDPK
ncbi:hypothetical protein F4810DRAFT_143772 [Camillea tinctor]|nr:hypothetical protein F4810DRAFT_143772 [Camillea tinctor]